MRASPSSYSLASQTIQIDRVVKKKCNTVNREMLQRHYMQKATVLPGHYVWVGLDLCNSGCDSKCNRIILYISQYIFSFFVRFQGPLYFIMHELCSPESRQAWITLLYPNRLSTFLKTRTTMSLIHQTKQWLATLYTMHLIISYPAQVIPHSTLYNVLEVI